MDIWLIAALAAWLPVACALALLVGHSIAEAERRKRSAEAHPVVERAAHRRLHRVP